MYMQIKQYSIGIIADKTHPYMCAFWPYNHDKLPVDSISFTRTGGAFIAFINSLQDVFGHLNQLLSISTKESSHINLLLS